MVALGDDLNVQQTWYGGAVFEQKANGFSALAVQNEETIRIYVRKIGRAHV